MQFNFLTYKTMANNLLKSVVASAVIATGVSAETPKLNAATSVAVRESSIDFKSQIAKIDKKITQIETKIKLIEQKNDLTSSDKRVRYYLNKDLKKLTAKKITIVEANNKQLDEALARLKAKEKIQNETLAIKSNEEKQIDETLAIIDNNIKKHKEQLSIADQKLAALNKISRIMEK